MSEVLEIVLRLFLAAVLGILPGFQRELAKKPAGLRTHMLVSLGSASFTVISIYGFTGNFDPSRVAAGIVAGIGVVGAGVIFRALKGDVTVGLTTASSIWVTAAIGMASGAGMYIIATVIAVIVCLILFIPKVKG